MRPSRFQALLTRAVTADGQLDVRTFAEAGHTTSTWGLLVDGPVHARVQVAARSALGDDYAQPEHIVTGAKHGPLPRVPYPTSLSMLEGYLVSLAVAAAPGEVKEVFRYTLRVKPRSVKYGATFLYHDGSAIFLYIYGE